MDENTIKFTVELEKVFSGGISGFYPVINPSKNLVALAIAYNTGHKMWTFDIYTNIILIDIENQRGFYDTNFLRGKNSFFKLFFCRDDVLVCENMRSIFTIKI